MFIKKSILIISNQVPGQYKPNLSPFVIDQAKSIEHLGHKVTVIDCNPRNRAFLLALVDFIRRLHKYLKKEKPSLIHIHSGGIWSFCASIIAHSFPKVITFHGSDLLFGKDIIFGIKKTLFGMLLIRELLENFIVKLFSIFSIPFMDYVILVNNKQIKKLLFDKKYKVQPCGVNTDTFKPKNKLECINKLNLCNSEHHILFINPQRAIKNVNLAIEVVEEVKKKTSNVKLFFAENVSNSDMPFYYCAAELLLITSFSEGSPVMVKEALACNTPILSVDVGDISKILNNVENCFIGPYDKDWLAEKMIDIIKNEKPINIRRFAMEYSLENVAKEIDSVYRKVKNNSRVN